MKKTICTMTLAFAALVALCLAAFSGAMSAGVLSTIFGIAILAAAAVTSVAMERLIHGGAAAQR